MLVKILSSLLVATSTNALTISTDASQRLLRDPRAREGGPNEMWGAVDDSLFGGMFGEANAKYMQDGNTGYVKDPWILYDNKNLPEGPHIDQGNVRISNYASVNNIKALCLDQGHNAFTMRGGDAYIKDIPHGVNLKDMADCSGCQSWVYVPQY